MASFVCARCVRLRLVCCDAARVGGSNDDILLRAGGDASPICACSKFHANRYSWAHFLQVGTSSIHHDVIPSASEEVVPGCTTAFHPSGTYANIHVPDNL